MENILFCKLTYNNNNYYYYNNNNNNKSCRSSNINNNNHHINSSSSSSSSNNNNNNNNNNNINIIIITIIFGEVLWAGVIKEKSGILCHWLKSTFTLWINDYVFMQIVSYVSFSCFIVERTDIILEYNNRRFLFNSSAIWWLQG